MTLLARILAALYTLKVWNRRRCVICGRVRCRVKHGSVLPEEWRVLT